MKTTTYTALISICHEEGRAPTRSTLEMQIAQGLEEGTREFPSVSAASVDLFEGDHLAKLTMPQSSRVTKVKAFHQDLRDNP